MPTVGVCRALHAFSHYSQWRAYIEGLGCEVTLSGPTTRRTIAAGVRLAPAEVCLPAKAFVGHVQELAGRVDYLLLPRIVCRRLSGALFFGCPKSLALPDLVRALFPRLNNGLELLVDERERTCRDSFLRLAGSLGRNGAVARAAWDRAAATAADSSRLTRRIGTPVHMFGLPAGSDPGGPSLGLPAGSSSGWASPGEAAADDSAAAGPRVGVVGHPYLLFDNALGLGVVDRLRRLGAVPLVPAFDDEPSPAEVRSRVHPNWLYEVGLLRGAGAFLRDARVSGLLLASSFACGTAAVVNELIRREVAGLRPMPVLALLLDEHTAEAGLATRLESFVDLLSRKRGRR
ncbi:hypothetical protein FJY71_07825 [candidate division WOR-3 bacterium]|nr:hypothetical protein [candidate division WOR-3 bacterium]